MIYAEILKDVGISPSIQRIMIMKFLNENRIHPTADIIYKSLKLDIPTLSKATIYNTLKLFVEKRIVSELSLFNNEIRYEFESEPHIHFKCIKCGEIYDIKIKFDLYENKIIEGHKVLEHHVNLRGICKNCRINDN